MPTRMHALRMSKSVQKSGYPIGETTIGMATENLVEIMERDANVPEVSEKIARFKQVIGGNWKFEDQFLAYRAEKAKEFEASAPKIVDKGPEPEEESQETEPTTASSAPPPAPPPRQVIAETAEEPSPPPERTEKEISASITSIAEQKAALLLYSAVKNTELVYAERFERDGNMGLKIEAPGVMVIEATLEGEDLSINPPDFGQSEGARQIKRTYEAWSDML
ncbi:hypothetical protein EU537_05765 [Candidatus Thorarchaeota archaeon]|nr:MAG: hypothetical protein EU537_05765 [Candidatus Thorarchaeota archaeon]